MNKILITGGNFINKGAHSMLFCVVNDLKIKYPDCEIVIIDLFPTVQNQQKDIYNFSIVNMHIRTLLRIAFPLLKLIVKPKPISDSEHEIINHFKTADKILDISGYGVSSHNQQAIWTYAILFPVKQAKKYNKPFIFLPQSIGPFDFKGLKKLFIWPLVKKYLKYPQYIFIREPECREYFKHMKVNNIIDSFDIVLQSKKLNQANIYKNIPEQVQLLNSSEPFITVIPNKQLLRLAETNKVIQIFTDIIEYLNKNNLNVVLLRHSNDDKELCQQIKDSVKTDKIQLLNEDLSPLEIQEIISNSKFVLAARYHGLIHSLKLGKPTCVLGWANKYKHIMDTFNLSNCYFDIRQAETSKILLEIDNILQNEKNYKEKIQKSLNKITSVDLYSYL